MTINKSNLIWLDLEMTGLEPATDKILEIATVVTDADLNILAEGPTIAIHQSDELLNGMDEWCTTQHGKSGLTARCKASTFDEEYAVAQTLEFLKQWVPAGTHCFKNSNVCATAYSSSNVLALQRAVKPDLPC